MAGSRTLSQLSEMTSQLGPADNVAAGSLHEPEVAARALAEVVSHLKDKKFDGAARLLLPLSAQGVNLHTILDAFKTLDASVLMLRERLVHFRPVVHIYDAFCRAAPTATFGIKIPAGPDSGRKYNRVSSHRSATEQLAQCTLNGFVASGTSTWRMPAAFIAVRDPHDELDADTPGTMNDLQAFRSIELQPETWKFNLHVAAVIVRHRSAPTSDSNNEQAACAWKYATFAQLAIPMDEWFLLDSACERADLVSECDERVAGGQPRFLGYSKKFSVPPSIEQMKEALGATHLRVELVAYASPIMSDTPGY
ncbi:hypothetical protein H9P43_004035 [Blastocladiella emersonii ATCC 22665]|nr:hypothetical protein H9P43_004035 [Blastocladiella emersonii ATCC 22665]